MEKLSEVMVPYAEAVWQKVEEEPTTYVTLLLAVGGVGVVLCCNGAKKVSRAIILARGIALTPRMARFASKYLRSYSFNEYDFYRCDGADEETAVKREKGMAALAKAFRDKYGKSIEASKTLLNGLSDLRFTDGGRVPFAFQEIVQKQLKVCSLVEKSDGPHLQDIDGNMTIDVSGSYGVNVCGTDVYKQCLTNGWERVKETGLVLGPLHPIIGEVLPVLKAISGKEEVSFHMSGTEAVMCAVRLAAFNTRRHLTVVFNGAYHGWWDGVQPGPGNERASLDILVLKDMSPASLRVIKSRASEIACVLVNPFQGFNPNAPPPNDLIMMTSSVRKAMGEGSAQADSYRLWLHTLREVCTSSDVPLIFDEVYSGFRMAPGGAQEYYDCQADMVVYGKTLGGGMPVGVVCGSAKLMKRFDPTRPIRVSYVIGTFSAHPLTLAAMAEFLKWVQRPETPALYSSFHARFGEWIADTNTKLAQEGLPIKLANLTSVWTILFTNVSRYNWMLQYYMRAEGVSMAWVGTGRLLVSLDFSDADLAELQAKVIRAAKSMQAGGWWWAGTENDPLTNGEISRRMAGEVLRNSAIMMIRESIVADVLALPEDYDSSSQRRHAPRGIVAFYHEVMRRKEDDHKASHSNTVNQFLHIVSSSMFIFCYVRCFNDCATAMGIGILSLFLRQMGHAILEPPCHDAEELLLGFNTRAKCFVFASYMLSPLAYIYHHVISIMDGAEPTLWNLWEGVADAWFWITFFFVFGHVALLTLQYGFTLSMVWFIKFITDPFTDLPSYRQSVLDVWTTKDWQTASLATLRGHMNKEHTERSSSLVNDPTKKSHLKKA